MTRFVYVLPAGRFRWEVRMDTDPLIEAAAEVLYNRQLMPDEPPWRLLSDLDRQYPRNDAAAVIEAVMPADPLFYRFKRDALIAARAIAILIGGEVQPHNRWGRIQDPDSYGPDSPRRRG